MQLSKTLSYVNSLFSKFPKFIESTFLSKEKLFLVIKAEYLSFVLNYLKNHTTLQYNVLVDITVIDRFSQKNRFEVYYFLRSTVFNNFLVLQTFNDGFLPLSSATLHYLGAGWLEREIWDMFGIFFSNHRDLRRILTDYGFQGFPLRKDFPLSGFIEVRYDDETKRVIYDSLELSQEFRFFDFQSPWQASEFLSL
jgi:NADH dehydrogenase (ubiquinone) Fe-S protein 3